MKKSVLLLVFIASTLMASAMNGPLKTFDPQKLGVDKEVINAAPEQTCMVCGECQGAVVCFVAGDCNRAGAGLTKVMIELHCLDGE